MKKNLTKNLKIFLLVLTVLCLSGCSMGEVSMDDLLRPPQLSESHKQVQDALKKIIGTAYQPVSPKNGQNRSGITFADLNGDGQNEAICLYIADGQKSVQILILQNYTKDGWQQIGSFSSDATAVDKLEFLDASGDGNQELAVGWGYLTGSGSVLEVLTLGTPMQSLYKGVYTQFVVAGKNSNRIILINSAAASATLLGYQGDKMTTLSSVPVDTRAKSILAMNVNQTDDGNSAVYMDTQLDNQMYGTEVLVISEDTYLENKLLTDASLISDRSLAIICADIDKDGLLEIPQTVAMPGDTDSGYFTYWCRFDGKALKDPLITFTSDAEKFYFECPSGWQNHVLIHPAKSGERTYDLVLRESGQTIYSIRIFTRQEYDQLEKSDWLFVLQTDEKVITIHGNGADGFALNAEQWESLLHTY